MVEQQPLVCWNCAKLAKLCRARDLTLDRVLRTARIGAPRAHEIEEGSVPTVSEAFMIADVLDCRVADLLDSA